MTSSTENKDRVVQSSSIDITSNPRKRIAERPSIPLVQLSGGYFSSTHVPSTGDQQGLVMEDNEIKADIMVGFVKQSDQLTKCPS